MAQDTDVYHTTYDTEHEEPTVAITETVAQLKEIESDELAPLYDCLDHVIDNIFSDPPDPSAEIEIRFTYEGYRITLTQDGDATFHPTS